MKTIVTLDKANQSYGFPQLDGNGQLQATGSLYGTASYANYALTASYAENTQTASYYNEVDPIFTAVSGTFATTGSNLFTDNQSIDAGSTYGFGSAIKYTNQGVVHFTSGISGSTFVIADTSANYYSTWAGADIKLQVGQIDSSLNTNLAVSGSLNAPMITGSLYGSSSWSENAVTASYIDGGFY